MSKNTKKVAVTPEQLEVAARRFRLKSGLRAGKGGTGGKTATKSFVAAGSPA